MKKYLLSRLTESSTWIGLAIILGAMFFPRWFVMLLGALLIISGDGWLKAWATKNVPALSAWLDEITK